MTASDDGGDDGGWKRLAPASFLVNLVPALGAALWPYLLPQPGPVLLGAALLGLIALLARRSRVAWQALAAGALLLGLALPGPPPANTPLPDTVQGVVTEQRGATFHSYS